jgi:hypothetical protein
MLVMRGSQISQPEEITIAAAPARHLLGERLGPDRQLPAGVP